MCSTCRSAIVLFVCSVLFVPAFAFFLGNSFGKDFTLRNRINHLDLDSDPRLLPFIEPTELICPSSLTRVPNLNSTCKHDFDCRFRPKLLCCPLGHHRFCLPAVPNKTVEPMKHKPFLGVSRHCPTTTEPLQEFLPVKNCTKDVECEPRICCPDGLVSYCRTAVPQLEPRTSHAVRVIRNFVSYLQCSPPPPPALDLFPKTCKYSFDCFPNICCQEKGKKVCRPAKRSILRLLASLS